MAGEIYTTFTFWEEVAGRIAKEHLPLYFRLWRFSLSFIVFLLPPIWKYAKEHNLVSQSDFLRRNIEVKRLGLLFQLLVLFPSSHILFYS